MKFAYIYIYIYIYTHAHSLVKMYLYECINTFIYYPKRKSKG